MLRSLPWTTTGEGDPRSFLHGCRVFRCALCLARQRASAFTKPVMKGSSVRVRASASRDLQVYRTVGVTLAPAPDARYVPERLAFRVVGVEERPLEFLSVGREVPAGAAIEDIVHDLPDQRSTVGAMILGAAPRLYQQALAGRHETSHRRER